MLRPSYTDLLEVLNQDVPEGEDEVTSRYTIVLAAAKRARQLIDGAEPATLNYKVDKPVSIAVQEMYENKLNIKQNIALDESGMKTKFEATPELSGVSYN